MKRQLVQWLHTHPNWQFSTAVLRSKIASAGAFFVPRKVSCAHEVLFIVGAGRSGNSLLRRLMVENFKLYIPAETYVIPSALHSYLQSGSMSWANQVNTVLACFEYHPEFSTMSRKGLSDVAVHCASLPKEQQNFGGIIYETLSFMAQQNEIEYTLIGDKTPLNTMSLGILEKVFPQAKFLFICRDPFDVVYSYLSMGRYTETEQAARRWATSHISWDRFKKGRSFRSCAEIFYSELVTNHTDTVNRIAEWLSLERRSKPIPSDFFWGDLNTRSHHAQTLHSVNNKSIGKGHQELSEDQINIVTNICSPIGLKFGYDFCK